MATTIAFVTEIRNDGHAMVVAEKGQGCASCGAAVQCHGGRNANKEQARALNRIGARVGDRVTLSLASGTLLSRLAVIYLLPVVGMLAGAFGGMNGAGERGSILMGLIGFVAGFAIALVISRIWSSRRPVLPEITRVINAASQIPYRKDAGSGASTRRGCTDH